MAEEKAFADWINTDLTEITTPAANDMLYIYQDASGLNRKIAINKITAVEAHKDTHDPNDGSDALDTAAPSELASVQASAAGTSHSLARADHQHQIQHSIADNHIVTVDDADAADDDYAKFTANGLEGRSYAEVRSDLGLGSADAPTFNGMTLNGDVQMNDKGLFRPYIKDYAEYYVSLGSDGGTRTVNLQNGNVYYAQVSTSANTFVFSNPPASGRAGSFTLILRNGGSQTVTWPASVDWPGGNAPSLTSSGYDVLTFITTDAGTTWLGFVCGLDVK